MLSVKRFSDRNESRMDTLLIFLKDEKTRKLRRVDVAAAYRPADRLPAAIIQSFEPDLQIQGKARASRPRARGRGDISIYIFKAR